MAGRAHVRQPNICCGLASRRLFVFSGFCLSVVLGRPEAVCEPTQDVLCSGILDDRQRNIRKRFQDPLSRWFVGQFLLVLWM